MSQHTVQQMLMVCSEASYATFQHSAFLLTPFRYSVSGHGHATDLLATSAPSILQL